MFIKQEKQGKVLTLEDFPITRSASKQVLTTRLSSISRMIDQMDHL